MEGCWDTHITTSVGFWCAPMEEMPWATVGNLTSLGVKTREHLAEYRERDIRVGRQGQSSVGIAGLKFRDDVNAAIDVGQCCLIVSSKDLERW